MIEHDILYPETSITLPETLTWKMTSKAIVRPYDSVSSKELSESMTYT